MPAASTLSVIVPAYNEEGTLATVVRKLLDVPFLAEIIVVDDCSTDSTGSIARDLAARYHQVRLIQHVRNQGKTAALITGIAATCGTIVIVQDSDLEYDPTEISDVITPIVNGWRTSSTARVSW